VLEVNRNAATDAAAFDAATHMVRNAIHIHSHSINGRRWFAPRGVDGLHRFADDDEEPS